MCSKRGMDAFGTRSECLKRGVDAFGTRCECVRSGAWMHSERGLNVFEAGRGCIRNEV